MKFEKTYRDFYNEVITEADTNATINKQINAVTDGLTKGLEKALGKKYEETQLKELLVSYAQSFVIEHEDEWDNFIRSLYEAAAAKKQFIKDENGNNVEIEAEDGKFPKVYVSKFQFMQLFFLYYFQKVFHYKKGYWLKGIKKCLKQAAQTIDLEKEDCTSNAVSQAVKVVQRGNKNILVKVYNSLKGYY